MTSCAQNTLFLLCLALAGCFPVQASQIQQRVAPTMLNMHAAAEAKDDANDSDDDDDDDGEATTSTQGGSVAKGDTEEAKGDTEAKEGVKKVEAKGDTEDEQPEVYEIASPKTAEQTRRDKAKTKLAANLREQAELEHTMLHLGDETASDSEIALSVKLVANETQSPAMASMLGHVWKELRMFEVPQHAEHVKEQLKHLRRDERALESELTAAHGKETDGNGKVAKEDGNKNKKADEKTDEKADEKVEKIKVDAHANAANGGGVSSGTEAVMAQANFWQMSRSQKKVIAMNTLVYLAGGILVAFLFQTARQRYPQAFAPQPRADTSSSPKDFTFSLFGCFGDTNMCLLGCFCPCLAWSDTLERKELLSFWKAFAAFFGMLLLHSYTMGVSSLFIVVIGVFFRQKLRAGYEMENGTPKSVAVDFLAWCFCQPCAIIQEAREESVLRNMVTADRVKMMDP